MNTEQEQPVLPGIEDHGIPGKDFIPVEWVDACEMYGKWKIVKQEQPEVCLKKELDEWMEYGPHTDYPWCSVPDAIEITARHFYELGRSSRKDE